MGQEMGHLTLCQDSGRHPRGGDPSCGPWKSVRHVQRPWGLRSSICKDESEDGQELSFILDRVGLWIIRNFFLALRR